MPGHFLANLRTIFAERGKSPALVHRGRTYTYGDLEGSARRFAGHLQRLGVEPGDRIAMCLAEKLDFLTAHLGTLFAGAVTLPLNPGLTREEMRFFLKDSGAKILVAGDDQARLAADLRADLPDLAAILPGAATDEEAAPYREPAVAPSDPCLLIYSSGTTGWPKGVVHTHGNVAGALRALGECWRFTPEDRVVNVLPLFHVHGLCFATHLTLLAGGCVHVEDKFDPLVTLDAIGRGTVFMAVPTIYYRFLEEPSFRERARRWQTVRLFTCGSAPIRAEVLPELEVILCRPVINRYGMTEAFVITSLPLDGPWPQGSVGLPLPGVEVRVVRADGTAANPGEAGSVQIRGPNLFHEYWRKPDATRDAFADGWFDTGDLGQRDAAGFLTLVGRKSDLIITNGFNVYPQVVERVLHECPGVREAAVVGVPDARHGERVVAAVVRDDPTLDEARLQDFCIERLVDYQRPRVVAFVDALPRNAMGKVLRRELRERVFIDRPL